MKKIRVLAVLTAVVMLIGLFAACGTTAPNASATSADTKAAAPAADTKAAAADKKLKIGVTYQNLQNEFILNIQDALRAKAKELNVDLIEADGQGKAENQISQVENFISQKVDAIILNPFDKDGDAPCVDKAVAAKIPIIVVNAEVSNLDKATAMVGSDDADAGRIEMQFIADKLNGKGNIVIIHGPNGHSAEVGRTKGNKEILAKYPDIKVLAEQTANWDRAQAMALMENWMQSGKEINAVVGQNDEMALGALKAVQAKNKSGIVIIGIDAIPDALKAVGDGTMAATVFQDARGQGAGAVDTAVKAAKGEKVEKKVYIPFQLVTKDNLANFQKK
jgi:inositol transport system substrate-binding protein